MFFGSAVLGVMEPGARLLFVLASLFLWAAMRREGCIWEVLSFRKEDEWRFELALGAAESRACQLVKRSDQFRDPATTTICQYLDLFQ